eukprot:12761561-Heterocapsa_arctica.AAC.1
MQPGAIEGTTGGHGAEDHYPPGLLFHSIQQSQGPQDDAPSYLDNARIYERLFCPEVRLGGEKPRLSRTRGHCPGGTVIDLDPEKREELTY